MTSWQKVIAELPLIPILRGISESEIVEVAELLLKVGFRCIEIPLNSPNAFHSIKKCAKHFADDLLVGAGTVLTPDAVTEACANGAQFIIMPHTDYELIRFVKQNNAIALPGIATPSEAFTALRAGADGLKCFPAEMITPAVTKALRAVLPKDTQLFPVGGISPEKMKEYYQVGVTGFGIGSQLFKPGKSLTDIDLAARDFFNQWHKLQADA